jgi:hypothetical protein
MKTLTRVLAMSLVVAAACKKDGENDSDAKFDPQVADMLAISQLSREEVIEICKRSVMFMFVGNAEDVAASTLPNSKPQPEPKDEQVDLREVMRHEFDELSAALSTTQCGTYARRVKGDLGPVLLATVYDGPEQDDSRIETHWYRWTDEGRKWTREKAQFWKISPRGKLEAAKADEKFELHLPTMISNVAAQLASMHAPGFDQTMYFFKSHGGRLLTAKENNEPIGPSLRHLLKTDAETKVWTDTAKHLFLFDPHGPNKDKKTTTEPEVYSAYWLKDNACSLLGQLEQERLSASEACGTCAEALKKQGKPLGKFSACKPPLLASNTLNSTGSGDSTLNSTGSGDSTLNSTGSGDSTLNSTGSGDSTLNSTGSGDSTLNSTGSGDSTLSAVGEGLQTLGGGKGFLHLGMPTIKKTSSLDSPDGGRRIASAVSYDMGDMKIAGVEPLRLPAGKNPRAPTLLILDSCFGDAGIGAAVKTKDGANAPVVVVSNPSPMLANVFNYGALNLTKYVAFSMINFWYDDYKQKGELDKHPHLKTMKEDIEAYLANNGLVDLPALNAALAKAKAEGRTLTSEEARRVYRPKAFRSLMVTTSINR